MKCKAPHYIAIGKIQTLIIPKKNSYGRKVPLHTFLKSVPMPHKSFLLPSIIPNILHYWKILTPLGPIQICYVHPVLHIGEDLLACIPPENK